MNFRFVIRVLNINKRLLLTRCFTEESTRIKGKPDANIVAPLERYVAPKNY